ncbi:MAG: 2,3-bisphosphoglycerate-independent phosphoglycerate mutase [Anaerolineaceae bacterium]|nr:2,3-bisphosphoglycerate-independent phosphoglycerate mutase [Anaerolineaceae bacterium]
MTNRFIEHLVQENTTRIVMVILDGLGGIPRTMEGRTELETASTPHMDTLAYSSSLGLTIPVTPGVTAGSGPGHLAIFGYDPIEYEIGRGALEALGVDFELGPDDIAARGNFCTLDKEGKISDRRAGRLPTEESLELTKLLSTIKIEGVEFFIKPIKEHRFAFIMRKKGMNVEMDGTDPLKIGVPPLKVCPRQAKAESSALLINTFIEKACILLKDKAPANMIMLRGFAKFPCIPSFTKKYRLNAAAIAVNGMYRGVARLVGMHVLAVRGTNLADEIATLEKAWLDFDFFYLHFKKTDTCGESGDFDGKCRAIEELDSLIPRLLALQPDVLIIGGDHSSPAVMHSHSWHPVPLLISSKYCRPDHLHEFGETACLKGSLGIIPAKTVMPLALAHAGRIAKYGA